MPAMLLIAMHPLAIVYKWRLQQDYCAILMNHLLGSRNKSKVVGFQGPFIKFWTKNKMIYYEQRTVDRVSESYFLSFTL